MGTFVFSLFPVKKERGTNRGRSMDPAAEAETVQFAESMLEGNDPSHDIGHARAVYRNSISIADDLDLSPRDRLVVFVAALLHDVADHKYPDAEVKRARLAAFVDSFSFFGTPRSVWSFVDPVSRLRHHSLHERLHVQHGPIRRNPFYRCVLCRPPDAYPPRPSSSCV